MKKLILIIAFLNANLWAINTNSYSEISVLKIWPKSVDIYLVSSEDHKCSKLDYKKRFLLAGDSYNEKYISFALSAFTAGKKVSLSYLCNTSGYPEINGIRIKK